MAQIKVAFAFVTLTAPLCRLLVNMHDQLAFYALPRGVVEVRQYAAQLVDLVFQKPDFGLRIHVCRLCLVVVVVVVGLSAIVASKHVKVGQDLKPS
jgi:ABC-type transport system involved in cytochrome c biogenesis permease component